MTTVQLLITVGIAAAVTLVIRALPFWVFPAGKKPPAFVDFLSQQLPAAVMAMLVVYCLKDVRFTSAAGFVPALAACVVVAALHLWKHKMILSIAAGTAVYMVLIRCM